MNKNGFVELIPTTHSDIHVTSSHSDHTKESKGPKGFIHGHDAEHWYNAYMALYEMYNQETESLRENFEQAMRLLESANQTVTALEAEIEELKRAKKKLSKKMKKTTKGEPASEEQQDDVVRMDSPFQHGIGFSVGPGQAPRVYDLSDPEGTTPKKKFNGVTLEVQPGRGFRINPQWK